MLRRTPLKRKTRLKARGQGAYARRERDVDYMRMVRTLPCMLSGVREAGPCIGGVEADHMGERAAFRKADDRTCAPLCQRHHRDRTDVRGYFAKLTKEQRRAWCRLAIARAAHAIALKLAGAKPAPPAPEGA
jgi:hypothetical protein